jgi:hypothetical protein
LLLPAENGQPFLPGFDRGFVDPLELQRLSVFLANFFFDVAIPEVSSQVERSIRVFVQGDVVRAFELNDVIACGLIFVISTGLGVLEEGQPQFLTRRPEGLDVFDLSFPLVVVLMNVFLTGELEFKRPISS